MSTKEDDLEIYNDDKILLRRKNLNKKGEYYVY